MSSITFNSEQFNNVLYLKFVFFGYTERVYFLGKNT